MLAAAEQGPLAAEATLQCSRRLRKATLRSPLAAAAAALLLAATPQALRPSPTLALRVSRQPGSGFFNVSLSLSSREICSECCTDASSIKWDDT